MEAEFSDEEFSSILGAFAEVDDLLIDWDVLRSPVRESQTVDAGATRRTYQGQGEQPMVDIAAFPMVFGQAPHAMAPQAVTNPATVVLPSTAETTAARRTAVFPETNAYGGGMLPFTSPSAAAPGPQGLGQGPQFHHQPNGQPYGQQVTAAQAPLLTHPPYSEQLPSAASQAPGMEHGRQYHYPSPQPPQPELRGSSEHPAALSGAFAGHAGRFPPSQNGPQQQQQQHALPTSSGQCLPPLEPLEQQQQQQQVLQPLVQHQHGGPSGTHQREARGPQQPPQMPFPHNGGSPTSRFHQPAQQQQQEQSQLYQQQYQYQQYQHQQQYEQQQQQYQQLLFHRQFQRQQQQFQHSFQQQREQHYQLQHQQQQQLVYLPQQQQQQQQHEQQYAPFYQQPPQQPQQHEPALPYTVQTPSSSYPHTMSSPSSSHGRTSIDASVGAITGAEAGSPAQLSAGAIGAAASDLDSDGPCLSSTLSSTGQGLQWPPGHVPGAANGGAAAASQMQLLPPRPWQPNYGTSAITQPPLPLPPLPLPGLPPQQQLPAAQPPHLQVHASPPQPSQARTAMAPQLPQPSLPSQLPQPQGGGPPGWAHSTVITTGHTTGGSNSSAAPWSARGTKLGGGPQPATATAPAAVAPATAAVISAAALLPGLQPSGGGGGSLAAQPPAVQPQGPPPLPAPPPPLPAEAPPVQAGLPAAQQPHHDFAGQWQQGSAALQLPAAPPGATMGAPAAVHLPAQGSMLSPQGSMSPTGSGGAAGSASAAVSSGAAAGAAAAVSSRPQGPRDTAAAAAVPTVSGASLLADLMAEAVGGEWAAAAASLGPLPVGPAKTAEELLAGLDLSDVFAPPKQSHAKRIRGHVRRAAELKAQLADRVRAIQRLAAENADLRGRARVMELVVRCRDEQLRLLQSYRTSADGKVYYVREHLALGGPVGHEPSLESLAAAAAEGRSPAAPPGAAAGELEDKEAVKKQLMMLQQNVSCAAAAAKAGEAAAAKAAAEGQQQQGPQQSGQDPQQRPQQQGKQQQSAMAAGVAALASMPASALLEMFRILVTELGISLQAVEEAQARAAAAGHGGGGGGGGAFAVPVPVPAALTAAAAQYQPLPLPRSSGDGSGADAADGGGDGGGGDGGHRTSSGNAQQQQQQGGAKGQLTLAGLVEGAPMLRLRLQTSRFRCILRYLGLVNEEVCRFVDTKLTGEMAPPEPGHWLRVVQALGLSQQQLADVSALHSCWQDWLGRVLSERRAIAAALDQLLSVNRYGAAYAEAAGQYGTDRDVIHKMHANVMREKILVVLVSEVLCCQILNDIQWARAIVHSYPYVMDARELVRAGSELYHSTYRRGLLALGS